VGLVEGTQEAPLVTMPTPVRILAAVLIVVSSSGPGRPPLQGCSACGLRPDLRVRYVMVATQTPTALAE
jgi:hypothetical protein